MAAPDPRPTLEPPCRCPAGPQLTFGLLLAVAVSRPPRHPPQGRPGRPPPAPTPAWAVPLPLEAGRTPAHVDAPALARAVLGQALLDLTRHGHATDAQQWLRGAAATLSFAHVAQILHLDPTLGLRLAALAPDLRHCPACGHELPTPWHRYCRACTTPKRGLIAGTTTPARTCADRSATLRATALRLLGTDALKRLPNRREATPTRLTRCGEPPS